MKKFLWILGVIGLAAPCPAYEFSNQLEVYGYFQAWMTAYEEMEDARGLFQHPSGDEATDSVSGFSLSRVRTGLKASFFEGLLGVVFQLKLEENVQVLDLFLEIKPLEGLSLQIGQFKIPSTHENLTDNRDLDFILRTELSEALVDYSLSRTTYASSLFYGNRAFLRDFGIGLKGEIVLFDRELRTFVMVGNGMGADLFIGGNTHKEFIITNGFQFFYGARVELEIMPEILVLGGHINYNKHDNMVFNSGRMVLDLNRLSTSGDLQAFIPDSGLRFAALLGRGKILDDFDDNGKIDFQFSGWEGRVAWQLNPLLRLVLQSSFLEEHFFELLFRYEDFVTEADESGSPTHQRNYTLGANYQFLRFIKVQFNAIFRRTERPFEPDLGDDVFLICLQAAI